MQAARPLLARLFLLPVVLPEDPMAATVVQVAGQAVQVGTAFFIVVETVHTAAAAVLVLANHRHQPAAAAVQAAHTAAAVAAA